MKSLKRKMLVCIIGLLLLLSIVNLVIGLTVSYKGIMSNLEADLDTTVKITDQAVSEKINGMKERGTAMAGEIARLSIYSSLQQKLNTILSTAETYGYIAYGIVDKDGLMGSTYELYNGMSVAADESYKKALSGEVVISVPHKNNAGEMIVTTWVPIEGTDQVLALILRGSAYSEMIQDIKVGKTGSVFMLDQKGTMIANVRPELVSEQQNLVQKSSTDKSYQSAAEVYSRMIKGESGTDRYDYEGSNRMCAFSPVTASLDGWSVGVTAPRSEMITSVKVVFVGMFLSSVIMLAIGVVITFFLANSIADPIIGLNKRMKLLAEGDLTSPVPVSSSKDEVGILVGSVGQTIVALKAYIDEISQMLDQISRGNLDIGTTVLYKGEFIRIETALNQIVNTLNEDFAEISSTADQVGSGSEQVSDGAQSLSQSTTEQASSVQQLAATITLISENIAKNADHAELASEMVGYVGMEIQHGNLQMQEMNDAMTDITSSSKKIGKIIKTIEDIAFQTNILALNAAVEAARAGAAGKGFAVVADEVRNLASKSSQASKETADLITASLKSVERGSKVSGETASSFALIAQSTEEVVKTINQITAASKDQAVSIHQVTQGIDQISSVIQTNSATSEESAAASEELSAMAQNLNHVVNRMTLKKR